MVWYIFSSVFLVFWFFLCFWYKFDQNAFFFIFANGLACFLMQFFMFFNFFMQKWKHCIFFDICEWFDTFFLYVVLHFSYFFAFSIKNSKNVFLYICEWFAMLFGSIFHIFAFFCKKSKHCIFFDICEWFDTFFQRILLHFWYFSCFL